MKALRLVEEYIAECEGLDSDGVQRRMKRIIDLLDVEATDTRTRLIFLDTVFTRLGGLDNISIRMEDRVQGLLGPCLWVMAGLSRELDHERLARLIRNLSEFIFMQPEELSQGELIVSSIVFHLLVHLSEDAMVAEATLAIKDYSLIASLIRFEPGKMIFFFPTSSSPLPCSISDRFVPVQIPYTRLADLANDGNFDRFFFLLSARIFKDGSEEDYDRMAGELYRKLLAEQRYVLSEFDRVRITDSEDLIKLQAYLNFKNVDCEESIQVEVEVRGKRIPLAVHREKGLLAWPRHVFPDNLFAETLDSRILNRLRASNWQLIPEKARSRLRFLVVSYLYDLLTGRLERYSEIFLDDDGGRFGRSQTLLENQNIREIPWQRRQIIPRPKSNHCTKISPQGVRQSPMRHKVSGHLRRLPPGRRASLEQLKLAAQMGIFVPPGFTFVKAYRRGTGLGTEKTFARPGAVMSSLEEAFQSEFPDEIRFVGNGAVRIRLPSGRIKVPDFVVEPFPESRKVIELHGEFWHQGEDVDELVRLYEEAGYDCLVIWGSEFDKDRTQTIERVRKWILR